MQKNVFHSAASVSSTGFITAPIAAAVTAHMIITKPVETLFRSGMNVKQQLKSADISTTAVTVGDFFHGRYEYCDKHAVYRNTESRLDHCRQNTSHHCAEQGAERPAEVGEQDKPVKYFAPSSRLLLAATANISSVMPADIANRSGSVTLLCSFCVSETDISEYLRLIISWVSAASMSDA